MTNLEQLQQAFPEVTFKEKNQGIRVNIYAYYNNLEMKIPDWNTPYLNRDVVFGEIETFFRL